MDSKYIHLIAVIVAVFFAGVYLRGESARKKDIKRELEAIQMRQTEINNLIGDINQVAAEKDSLLSLQIAQARSQIELLKRGESLTRDSINVLGREISATQLKINQLVQQINAVPDFIFSEENIHSVSLDPDITPGDSIDYNPIQTFVGQPLLEARTTKPLMPTFLGVAKWFAGKGVKEVPLGSNRGPKVEQFLASVGLFPSKDRPGKWKSYPYCAAFISFCLERAGNIETPEIRTAGARKFITRKSIEARGVLRAGTAIAPGTLVIWARNARNPKDTSGHVGFVLDWEGQAGTTLEANTGSGQRGSQRDGDGVYVRKRMLSPGSAFRITHFTPVTLN